MKHRAFLGNADSPEMAPDCQQKAILTEPFLGLGATSCALMWTGYMSWPWKAHKSTLFSFWVLWPLPVGPAQFHPREPRTQQRTKAGGHMLLQVFFTARSPYFKPRMLFMQLVEPGTEGWVQTVPKYFPLDPFHVSCCHVSCSWDTVRVPKIGGSTRPQVFQLQRTRVAMERLQLPKQSLDLLCFFSSDHGSSNIYHLWM